jgi:hypothetical protein
MPTSSKKASRSKPTKSDKDLKKKDSKTKKDTKKKVKKPEPVIKGTQNTNVTVTVKQESRPKKDKEPKEGGVSRPRNIPASRTYGYGGGTGGGNVTVTPGPVVHPPKPRFDEKDIVNYMHDLYTKGQRNAFGNIQQSNTPFASSTSNAPFANLTSSQPTVSEPAPQIVNTPQPPVLMNQNVDDGGGDDDGTESEISPPIPRSVNKTVIDDWGNMQGYNTDLDKRSRALYNTEDEVQIPSAYSDKLAVKKSFFANNNDPLLSPFEKLVLGQQQQEIKKKERIPKKSKISKEKEPDHYIKGNKMMESDLDNSYPSDGNTGYDRGVNMMDSDVELTKKPSSRKHMKDKSKKVRISDNEKEKPQLNIVPAKPKVPNYIEPSKSVYRALRYDSESDDLVTPPSKPKSSKKASLPIPEANDEDSNVLDVLNFTPAENTQLGRIRSVAYQTLAYGLTSKKNPIIHSDYVNIYNKLNKDKLQLTNVKGKEKYEYVDAPGYYLPFTDVVKSIKNAKVDTTITRPSKRKSKK